MNKMLKGILLVSGLIAVAPAMAATSWTMTGNSSTSGTYGNSRMFTGDDGTTTVTARAWANTGSNGTLETAYLGAYGGGLGVTNRYEGSGGSDMHTADNSGSQDVIELAFNKAVNITQVKNGYYTNDSDLSILAYIGAGNPPPSLSGATYASLLLNGWVSIGNLSNPLKNLTNTGATEYSSHWLIGAANSLFGAVDQKSDWVKLKLLAGNICATSANGGVCGGQPGTGVSEPGSLALAGLGLLGVIGLRRRQH